MSKEWDECPNCGDLENQRDRLEERVNELEAENGGLKAEAGRLRGALETIAAWPFDIMGDCVADARQLAAAALQEGLPLCAECGKYPADYPSKTCTGCAAYCEHTAV